jgi:hypothetical protein
VVTLDDARNLRGGPIVDLKHKAVLNYEVTETKAGAGGSLANPIACPWRPTASRPAEPHDDAPDLVERTVNRDGRDRHEGDPGQDVALA